MRRRLEPVYWLVVHILLVLFRLVRLDVRGVDDARIPAEGGAVLAITHFGYLEFAMTGKVVWKRHHRYVRFLATAAAFRHPVAGPLMRAMRHVPVDRAAGAGAFGVAVERLHDGALIGVFPEAQVNRAWVVGECKTGAVRMAAEAGVPLYPVAVWGGHRFITRGRKIPLRKRFGLAVRVHVGEPMTCTVERAVAQTAELRERLQELVDVAQKTYPQRPVGEPWWLPASLGGSAPTPEQAADLDRADDQKRLQRRAS